MKRIATRDLLAFKTRPQTTVAASSMLRFLTNNTSKMAAECCRHINIYPKIPQVWEFIELDPSKATAVDGSWSGIRFSPSHNQPHQVDLPPGRRLVRQLQTRVRLDALAGPLWRFMVPRQLPADSVRSFLQLVPNLVYFDSLCIFHLPLLCFLRVLGWSYSQQPIGRSLHLPLLLVCSQTAV